MNGFAQEIPHQATGQHACNVNQINHQPCRHGDANGKQRNIDGIDILDVKQYDNGGNDDDDGNVKDSHADLPRWLAQQIG